MVWLRCSQWCWFWSWLCLCVFLGLSGCGGGGSSSGSEPPPPTAETSGEVIIGLTDAEGDFLSYTVEVLSLRLARADGTEVETLPLATSVDFAQYTDLTEFLTAATVPSGVYVGASMVLDYSNARIVVENAAGEAVAATAVDSQGNPLGQLQVRVNLPGSDEFRIAPGIPAHITLDFDLEASHSVNFSQTPAEVTVEPVLIANTLLEEPKSHRLRGLLGEVSVEENAFTVVVRPFYRLLGDFGSLRVHVDEATTYEINQVGYGAGEGLTELALLPENTAVVVLGELIRVEGDAPFRFTASQVFAGTSVPWGDKDILSGHVIARSGDTLTVKGATVVRDDNEVLFSDTVAVTLGANTTVTQQGDPDAALGIEAVSVGQRLDIIGRLDPAAGGLTMDASEGHVRLRFTHIQGVVQQVSPLIIDLQAIGRHRVDVFDFSGTGIGPDEDSDPDNYEVDTSALTLASVGINDPVRVRGFVNDFGQAPADFDAHTVVTVENAPARLGILWAGEGATEPFSLIGASSLVVDMENPDLGSLHHVFRNAIAVDLTGLGANTTLAPRENSRGLYVLAGRGEVHMFTDFSAYTAEIIEQLDGATAIKTLHGLGRFDDTSATLTTRQIVIKMKTP